MKRSYREFVAFVVLYFATGVLAAQDVIDLSHLSKIKQGFRSSIDIIESIQLEYDILPLSSNDLMNMRCKYLGKKSSFFLEKEPLSGLEKNKKSGVNESKKVYVNKQNQIEVTGKKANIFAANPMGNCLGAEGPWFRAGIEVTADPILTWDNFLDTKYVTSISNETVDGVPLSRVQTTDGQMKCIVYFSPRNNYMVMKYTTELNQRNENGIKWVLVSSFDCLEFQEVGPGLFFPKRTQNRSASKFEDGRPDLVIFETSTDFTSVKINIPIPEETFEYKIPEGIMVNDFVKKISYKVNKDGEIIGEPGRLDGKRSEPSNYLFYLLSYWRTILICSVSVIGVYFYFARWKSR